MDLHLSAGEQTLLEELLLDAQRRLFLEISKTDHLDYRQRLRDREQLLETLLARVAAPEAVGAGGGTAPRERLKHWSAGH